jgi:hypothetical protein
MQAFDFITRKSQRVIYVKLLFDGHPSLTIRAIEDVTSVMTESQISNSLSPSFVSATLWHSQFGNPIAALPRKRVVAETERSKPKEPAPASRTAKTRHEPRSQNQRQNIKNETSYKQHPVSYISNRQTSITRHSTPINAKRQAKNSSALPFTFRIADLL